MRIHKGLTATVLLVLVATALGAWQYGYIDKSGQFKIPARFQRAKSFSEGLAAVKVNGHWGFINKTGKQVIAPVYDTVTSFHEKRAWVDSSGVRALIDPSGKRICKRTASLGVSDFHDGRARAQFGKPLSSPQLWGYVDLGGKTAVDSGRFLNMGDFSGGLARVGVGTRDSLGIIEEGCRTCFIDPSGRIAVEPEAGTYWVAIPPHEDPDLDFGCGRALFEQDRKWGYMNLQGKTVIPARFKHARRFSEGLAVVQEVDEAGKESWYYIDTAGTRVAHLDAEPAGAVGSHVWPLYAFGDFHEGMAATYVPDSSGEHRFGFVSRDGKTRFGAYDLVQDYSEGLAAVRPEWKWGYVDKTGTIMTPFRFSPAEPFREGLACVAIEKEEE